MPVILADDYAHSFGKEPDPRDVMRPFPAELMRMWLISAWGYKPENDHPSILEFGRAGRNPARVGTGLAVGVSYASSITDQAAGGNELALSVNRGHRRRRPQ
jgi:hypothetical protein